MLKMYIRLMKYGLLTPGITITFNSVTRDYKQSLVKELEDVTQKEFLVESDIQRNEK